MDRYAVIGHPIGHSKSPAIHSAFAAATGQILSYEAIEAPLGAGQFAATVERFRSQGGRGVNVTLPFKPDACAYATHLAESARCAGAANALKFEGDRCLAENFDGSGLVRDLSHNLGLRLAGRTVLLLGAGGASRGAILPLLRARPAQLWVLNRSAAKAEALVREFLALGADAAVLHGGGFDELAQSVRFDLVLNATSASLSAETLPLPARTFKPDGLAYDMVYGKGLTPFLRQAQQAGVRQLADGVGMLVEQAAEAFAWWRGVRPTTTDVIRRLSLPLI
ncbi:shikimate 5-dehydrogenase [Serpentinimonas raichei]|uniref:Shikimate dehydrogenase (NADP(+)) n=1 Tax=Serpentinimonas raichei TaxID=1458425 RepID=A0A060NIN6_9BURK|nr:shikimate dehydrogenase [Serpentinimonas raichei]BAO80800.1 shikimate 5-dehydrogenase [Serpentinimonas raichei]